MLIMKTIDFNIIISPLARNLSSCNTHIALTMSKEASNKLQKVNAIFPISSNMKKIFSSVLH